jgi:predicted alpha/beta-fold hydrolase
MPLIRKSTYRPPPLLANGHLQSILPSLFRRVDGVGYRRERIDMEDGDFIDIDHLGSIGGRLVVLCHGLEGSTARPYMQGMAKAFYRRGWGVTAVNFRGCSGEPNRLFRSYHSGATEDLETVCRHVLQVRSPSLVALVGFSLGGNLVLKYIGERGATVDPRIQAAAALSVPCDLKAAAFQLARPANALYMKRFVLDFYRRMQLKSRVVSEPFDPETYRGIRTFEEMDNRYTAPAHGFRDAEEYWKKCSARRFLADIAIPTLLLSARNDPFLPPACYPFDLAGKHAYLYLETPDSGGHVGFITLDNGGEYWHETRVTGFIRRHTTTPEGKSGRNR